MLKAHILAAAVLVSAACIEGGGVTEPLPLAITITASDTTAAAGDSIRFEVNAQGGTLLGVAVEWGDGVTDSTDARAARTLRVRYRKAYELPGEYAIAATAEDAFQGHKTASLNVTIQ
jgi:hypothetical protein